MLRVLQKIRGAWQEFRGLVLEHSAGAPPEGIGEGGVYYDSTLKAPMYYDGTQAKPMAGTPDHEALTGLLGGETGYHGHNSEAMQQRAEAAGAAGGYLVLDGQALIPIDKIPVGLLGGLTPKGAWDPATNTPTLANPAPATTRGWFYIASGSSEDQLGKEWKSGDWAISDGSVWQKIDNTDKVASVFGRTGAVAAQAGDYNLDQVNDGTTYKRVTAAEKAQYAAAYTHSQSAHAPANADNTQAAIAAAAAKTTPVDADVVPLLDSAASWAVKKLSWANVKATLKSYMDTLYSTIGHTHDRLYKVVAEGKNIDETPILANQFTAYMVLNPTGTLPVTPLEVAYITEQTYRDTNVIFQTLSTADSDRRFWRRRTWSGWLPWVEISTSIHASRHSAGGADPVSIDLSQIANMSAFMRTVNDDATAADARSTLGAAATTHAHIISEVTGLRDALDGKANALSRGIKYYRSDSAARWHGILVIDCKYRWNGGGAHVRVMDRTGTYDVYVRCEGGENTAIVDRFHVMYSGVSSPIFKARIDGYRVYLYKKDSWGWIDTSVMDAGCRDGMDVALFDYDSETEPEGFNQYSYCSYEVLKWVNGLTGDVQAQLDGKAPTNHASPATTYGVGDASNYGHVKVDGVPTDGSTNAVSSNGVYDSFTNVQNQLNNKKNIIESGYISSGGGTAKWWDGPYIRVRNTSDNADSALMIISVFTTDGDNDNDMYSARVMISIKNQFSAISTSTSMLDCDEKAYGKVYSRYDMGGGYSYITLGFYIPGWTTLRYEIESATGYYSINTSDVNVTLSSNANILTPNRVYTSNRTYAPYRLVGEKGGYCGLDVGGGAGMSLMEQQAPGYGGIYDQAKGKWVIVRTPEGHIYTHYPPAANADDESIPTTAWVKDVALQLGSGLGAGTQVVSRPYVSGQAHNAGIIYLEY